jgi:hypothetical protein
MSRGYNAGGLFVFPRPDEIVVPLRRDEFDTLSEGGVSEEKANRDLYIGGGFSALAGLVGVLVTTDWASAWQPEHRWRFLIPFLALGIMVAGSVVGACIHQGRLKRTSSNSPFSRLRERLLGLFNEPRTLEAEIQKPPSGVVKQIDAYSGTKWEKVASLFWLGNDLEWTRHTAVSGKPKERISLGLIQCNHHLSELGLADSVPGKQLSAAKLQLASTPEAALSQEWRNDFAARISQATQAVSDMAKSEQRDFQPNPR